MPEGAEEEEKVMTYRGVEVRIKVCFRIGFVAGEGLCSWYKGRIVESGG